MRPHVKLTQDVFVAILMPHYILRLYYSQRKYLQIQILATRVDNVASKISRKLNFSAKTSSQSFQRPKVAKLHSLTIVLQIIPWNRQNHTQSSNLFIIIKLELDHFLENSFAVSVRTIGGH